MRPRAPFGPWGVVVFKPWRWKRNYPPAFRSRRGLRSLWVMCCIRRSGHEQMGPAQAVACAGRLLGPARGPGDGLGPPRPRTPPRAAGRKEAFGTHAPRPASRPIGRRPASPGDGLERNCGRARARPHLTGEPPRAGSSRCRGRGRKGSSSEGPHARAGAALLFGGAGSARQRGVAPGGGAFTSGPDGPFHPTHGPARKRARCGARDPGAEADPSLPEDRTWRRSAPRSGLTLGLRICARRIAPKTSQTPSSRG